MPTTMRTDAVQGPVHAVQGDMQANTYKEDPETAYSESGVADWAVLKDTPGEFSLPGSGPTLSAAELACRVYASMLLRGLWLQEGCSL